MINTNKHPRNVSGHALPGIRYIGLAQYGALAEYNRLMNMARNLKAMALERPELLTEVQNYVDGANRVRLSAPDLVPNFWQHGDKILGIDGQAGVVFVAAQIMEYPTEDSLTVIVLPTLQGMHTHCAARHTVVGLVSNLWLGKPHMAASPVSEHVKDDVLTRNTMATTIQRVGRTPRPRR